jgi:hypothetical protein
MIDSKKFNFSFFLSSITKVKDLTEGALKFGGATEYDNGTYSNIPGDNFIHIQKNNQISIFIPSTKNCNIKTNNEKYIQYSLNYLQRFYDITKINHYNTKGSWYSEDKKDVIEEDITIITVNTAELSEIDINIFVELANWIKKELSQEGVSIAINSSLAIV